MMFTSKKFEKEACRDLFRETRRHNVGNHSPMYPHIAGLCTGRF